MKYGKLFGILLLVILCSLFLFSSDTGEKNKSDKEKEKLTVFIPEDSHLELDLFRDLDVLYELEEWIKELVEVELNDLDLNIQLEGLEDSLGSLRELEKLSELECLKALEDLDLENELKDFFIDFDWNDFVLDFEWDWDFNPLQ